ncbi:hypothetical protein ZHAS_00009448 [Anopheles sinensis]|uniref:Uncharacterized protein n=1 Tax=Anopheles sinensis TaxID=74873 RepID=A0A084VV95_ANOSI|nr:hypothetical protein ZHAS_00009448 [Anopheles sinensis]
MAHHGQLRSDEAGARTHDLLEVLSHRRLNRTQNRTAEHTPMTTSHTDPRWSERRERERDGDGDSGARATPRDARRDEKESKQAPERRERKREREREGRSLETRICDASGTGGRVYTAHGWKSSPRRTRTFLLCTFDCDDDDDG